MMDLAADDKSKITTHPANQDTQCNSKYPDLKLPHSRQNQTYDDYESRRFASLLRCKLEEQTVSSLFRLAIVDRACKQAVFVFLSKNLGGGAPQVAGGLGAPQQESRGRSPPGSGGSGGQSPPAGGLGSMTTPGSLGLGYVCLLCMHAPGLKQQSGRLELPLLT